MFAFTPLFQIAYLAANTIFFSAVALVTRATARRAAGALCSTLVFAAMSGPLDLLGRRAGWWIFPSCDNPPHPPLAVYVGQALACVGCVALVGWRVQRRFGARGVTAFAALVCGLGLVRDFSLAAVFPMLIRFGPMPASAIADLGAWALVVLVAFSVMRLVSGPVRADALRGA